MLRSLCWFPPYGKSAALQDDLHPGLSTRVVEAKRQTSSGSARPSLPKRAKRKSSLDEGQGSIVEDEALRAGTDLFQPVRWTEKPFHGDMARVCSCEQVRFARRDEAASRSPGPHTLPLTPRDPTSIVLSLPPHFTFCQHSSLLPGAQKSTRSRHV